MSSETPRGHGRVTLVTGGTDGLGRAAAVMLAERGYRVFAGGRNAERIAALQKFAGERKLPLEAIAMDVCDDSSVNAAIGNVERIAGPVEVLVNNAGIAIAAVMEEITLADLRKQFETNYFGLVRVTQRVLPGMRSALRGTHRQHELDRGKNDNAALRAVQFEQTCGGSGERCVAPGALSIWNSRGVDRAWLHSHQHQPQRGRTIVHVREKCGRQSLCAALP